MSADDPGVLIVGAGHAGGTAAALLRQYGYAGPVRIVGEEPLPPYQRPPLSKAWLKGEADSDSLLLRPREAWADLGVDLQTGTTVAAIDLEARKATLASGADLPFSALILATGATARTVPLPGADHSSVLRLRTATDADRIRAALGPDRRVVIIGGGYVGLEVAASARALGAEATIIEREPRLLARVASPELAAAFDRRHRAEGVEIVCAARPVEVLDGRSVALDDGRLIEGDAVLVGVGAAPCDALARAAGLACADGVIVDERSRASASGVWAIGDCAFRPSPLFGLHMRIESVPSALEQARQAAADIAGAPQPQPEVPWFWSDQYDLKLQIAGIAVDPDQRIVRGDPGSDRFSVWSLRQGRVLAVEAVGAPADFMGGKQLIARRSRPDPGHLADANVPIKALLA